MIKLRIQTSSESSSGNHPSEELESYQLRIFIADYTGPPNPLNYEIKVEQKQHCHLEAKSKYQFMSKQKRSQSIQEYYASFSDFDSCQLVQFHEDGASNVLKVVQMLEFQGVLTHRIELHPTEIVAYMFDNRALLFAKGTSFMAQARNPPISPANERMVYDYPYLYYLTSGCRIVKCDVRSQPFSETVLGTGLVNDFKIARNQQVVMLYLNKLIKIGDLCVCIDPPAVATTYWKMVLVNEWIVVVGTISSGISKTAFVMYDMSLIELSRLTKESQEVTYASAMTEFLRVIFIRKTPFILSFTPAGVMDLVSIGKTKKLIHCGTHNLEGTGLCTVSAVTDEDSLLIGPSNKKDVIYVIKLKNKYC